MTQLREHIKCSCCGTQILAERVGDTIVVKAKRHGVAHIAVIDLTKETDTVHNNTK